MPKRTVAFSRIALFAGLFAGAAGFVAGCSTQTAHQTAHQADARADAGPAAAKLNPTAGAFATTRPSFSGIYPHLAMFNNEGECGTGAVVPWAGRLWVVTYAPHQPKGSSDKLYEITEDLKQTVRPESIGGTPANRMIHRESNQLFIGPHAIDGEGNVRTISYKDMPGRHTANARHLTDPAGKIYYLTMEEGVYEVDVKTLAVRELYQDGNSQKEIGGSLLPGYHGKGAYSGQGRLIYANNGERGNAALTRPETTSGVLAEWEGEGKEWRVVRRNQFTDVTGPNGIFGSEKPETDPIWSIGWDHRSLILMVLDKGTWHSYRLPKGSHSYDGAHGWNTEWPRIRDVGTKHLLMTMHGTFWAFPKTFSASDTAGIMPISNYVKVIGDFARWKDKIVFGCDDTAKSEFLNKRKAKGEIAPGQSQSNLWFVDPAALGEFGPAYGKGAVWLRDEVKAGVWSDPYLVAGYAKRGLHLSHGADYNVQVDIEADATGKGDWKLLKTTTVGPKGYAFVELPAGDIGEWARLRSSRDAADVTAQFIYANHDPRKPGEADAKFDGLAKPADTKYVGGLARTRGENKRTLSFAAVTLDGTAETDLGYYELDADAKLVKVDDPKAFDYAKKHTAIPRDVLKIEAGSVLYVDDKGKRWRLPKGDAALDAVVNAGLTRIDREVCTERDMFNSSGTFYELPAENAGGFGKVRPIATHNRRIYDYCTYRGLLVLTGIAGDTKNAHVIRSDDGKAAVWAGTVDDLWKLGKPVGVGGPWKDSAAKAGEPSDPYLMNAYDTKKLTLSASEACKVKVEVDLTGDGLWVAYQTLDVKPGEKAEHAFPEAFQACWIRFTADKDVNATAELKYE